MFFLSHFVILRAPLSEGRSNLFLQDVKERKAPPIETLFCLIDGAKVGRKKRHFRFVNVFAENSRKPLTKYVEAIVVLLGQFAFNVEG